MLIEAFFELKKEKDVLGDRCNALERQVKDLLSHRRTEESGLSIGLSYSKVLTGNKNINEAEVVLLTKVAREAKQHENIQKIIVISGLPECTSSEVKERIESDRAAVNKLVEMLDVDMS